MTSGQPIAPEFRYNDRLFRLTIVLLVSLFVSAYGGSSIQEAFSDPWFFVEYTATYFIASLLVEWINFVTCRLDRAYDWEHKGGARLVLQLALGIIIPAVAELFFAALWFRMIGTDIRRTTFIHYAFPLIVLLITIFNLYYFTHYLYLKWQRKVAGQEDGEERNTRAGEIPVYYGGNMQYLPVSDILYAYRDGKYNYVKTSRHGGTYVISLPLDKLEETMDSRLFFRLNRQIIAHRVCCQGHTPAEHGKIRVHLSPPPPLKQPVVVSQKRAPAFRDWIDLKTPPD